jgi:hypothetical protein
MSGVSSNRDESSSKEDDSPSSMSEVSSDESSSEEELYLDELSRSGFLPLLLSVRFRNLSRKSIVGPKNASMKSL